MIIDLVNFQYSVTGGIKNNGLPYKNAKFIFGSNTILNKLKNSFGKNELTGTSLQIDYLNDNEGNIKNIRQYY